MKVSLTIATFSVRSDKTRARTNNWQQNKQILKANDILYMRGEFLWAVAHMLGVTKYSLPSGVIHILRYDARWNLQTISTTKPRRHSIEKALRRQLTFIPFPLFAYHRGNFFQKLSSFIVLLTSEKIRRESKTLCNSNLDLNFHKTWSKLSFILNGSLLGIASKSPPVWLISSSWS